MSPVSGRLSHCLLCTFQVSEWLVPSFSRHVAPSWRHSSVKPSKARSFTIRRTTSKRLSKGLPISVSFIRPDENPFIKAGANHSPEQLAKYELFEQLVGEQFISIFRNLSFLRAGGRSSCMAWGINSPEDLDDKKAQFFASLRQAMAMGYKHKDIERNPLFYRLRRAFVNGGVSGLRQSIQFLFVDSVVKGKFPSDKIINSSPRQLGDLCYPSEWYPATRAIQRTVHLHIGPTNSGKTYQALKKLEAAQSGVYAGPLRLLAHEVYTRFNAKGKPCALITGEERRVPEGMIKSMSSCTVEMVPLNVKVDVAVIDEIQMIGDRDRGWAWTQAFLGVQAKELHLCGELRTEELVRKLCASVGDKLIVHRYERLSPLELQKSSINGNLKRLEKGDAIILFSRVAIHDMKKKIEDATGRKCAVVYGSLPPETRAQQAALFNDPSNEYDFLAASDAIGMGLNLSVRRIIFESTTKHDGLSHRLIQTSEIKQIGGRAGRYKSAHDAVNEGQTNNTNNKQAKSSNVGFVTTLQNFDLPVVRRGMETDAKPIKTAGIIPPDSILKRFASYFPPGTPFSYILLRLYDISSISPDFFLCPIKDQVLIADIIEPYKLTISDRIKFIAAPCAIREPEYVEVLEELAKCVADQSNGHLLDLKALPLDLLDMEIHEHSNGVMGYLKDAEFLHKAITTYLWLSYRFNGIFISQALAFHLKDIVEVKINECLDNINYDPKKAAMLKALRAKTVRRGLAAEDELRDEAEGELFDIETDIPTPPDVELPDTLVAVVGIDGEVGTGVSATQFMKMPCVG